MTFSFWTIFCAYCTYYNICYKVFSLMCFVGDVHGLIERGCSFLVGGAPKAPRDSGVQQPETL